ncbi:polyprenyl synthetase family protein [Sphingomonas piscis]|uniref:Polyprenyl synthetase family protein n=1 Tax=Sphingomonas piscis TaxID=2714943 RepID=A0A6G7YSF0_9SPHN|nr:farnesyl diphosphate synthase [Sphingomonas piscis]QIK79651.1 polyprenyl synthetase family protein [Sphingomonas piscis]
MSTIPEGVLRSSLQEAMADVAREIDAAFEAELQLPDDPSARLYEAMRHAAVGGGKRLRPLLTCTAADLFGVPRSQSLRAGLAVECIHVHSLIHDDLPCMDDDALRRGKPTVHVAFDEATAVLAGDALLALSFQILSAAPTHPSAEVRAHLVTELARASGAWGMAGGQMLDLFAAPDEHDLKAITRLQRLKTGALIGWCLDAGAILGEASGDVRTHLRGYGQKLGLAFQIADDLLDVCGEEAAVGKRLQKDAEQGKATFVSLLGVERARQQADLLIEQAVEHLRPFGSRGSLLAELAEFVIARDR